MDPTSYKSLPDLTGESAGRCCCEARKGVLQGPGSAFGERMSVGAKVVILVIMTLCISLSMIRAFVTKPFNTGIVRRHASSFSAGDYVAEMETLSTKLVGKFGHVSNTSMIYTAVSFFHFVKKSEFNLTEAHISNVVFSLKQQLSALDVKGTYTISDEGYNSALIIPTLSLGKVYRTIVDIDPHLHASLDWNVGTTHYYDPELTSGDKGYVEFPFKKLIVKSKFAVLTDRIANEEIDFDWTDAGPELEAHQWHEEITANKDKGDNILLLDCRNDYESEMGTFDSATPLNTSFFSESWDKIDELVANKPKNARILTFCTGGIRCIKVNAYLKQKHKMTNIARLKKGIIAYTQWLEKEEEGDEGSESEEFDMVERKKESLFQGENFLFDRRRL